MEIAVWIALGLSVINFVVLFLVIREIGSLRLATVRKSGLPVDSPLPAFSAPTLAGGAITDRGLRQRLLLFVSPDCAPCQKLLGDIARFPAADRPPMTIGISAKSSFDPEKSETEFMDLISFADPGSVFVDDQRRVFTQLRVPVTPFVYVINEQGRVRGSGVVSAAGELRDMARAIA